MAACGLALVLAAAACTAGPGSGHQPGAPATSTPSSTPSRAAPRPLGLAVTPAAYQLPSAIAREVVLVRGPDLLIIGGLTQQGTTTGTVIQLNPVTGQARRAGRLPAPTHDAAGAVLGDRPYVFGGGGQAIVADAQVLRGNGTASVAGQLPGPRADLSAVTLGTTAYVIGGFGGAAYASPVLATSDGRHFRAVARLPVPVRYAAVAGVGNRIWVFGGETPSGLTSAIQRIDVSTGQAAVVGHLPAPLFGATGFALGDRVFIAGGQAARHGQLTTRRWVLAYHIARRRVTFAGRLPVPVSNAAAAVLGNTAYLVGGSDGQREIPTVTRLRLVPLSPASTPSSA